MFGIKPLVLSLTIFLSLSVSAFSQNLIIAKCFNVNDGFYEKIELSMDPLQSGRAQVMLNLKGELQHGKRKTIAFKLEKDSTVAVALYLRESASEFGYHLDGQHDFVLRFAPDVLFEFPVSEQAAGMPFGSPRGIAFLISDGSLVISDLDLVGGNGGTHF